MRWYSFYNRAMILFFLLLWKWMVYVQWCLQLRFSYGPFCFISTEFLGFLINLFLLKSLCGGCILFFSLHPRPCCVWYCSLSITLNNHGIAPIDLAGPTWFQYVCQAKSTMYFWNELRRHGHKLIINWFSIYICVYIYTYVNDLVPTCHQCNLLCPHTHLHPLNILYIHNMHLEFYFFFSIFYVLYTFTIM